MIGVAMCRGDRAGSGGGNAKSALPGAFPVGFLFARRSHTGLHEGGQVQAGITSFAVWGVAAQMKRLTARLAPGGVCGIQTRFRPHCTAWRLPFHVRTDRGVVLQGLPPFTLFLWPSAMRVSCPG